VKSPARSKCSVENFTMVLCGRVVPKKGIIQGIALFQALARSNDCRLVLVLGRRSEIEDHATYARIKEAVMSDSRISVRHDLKESELYELFSESSIGIIPSENYESIPTVLIEMLAAGLPVCATYQWGIPEILPSTRGLTGNLDQDVDVLRACLGQSMGDETTRVQEEFSYTKLIDQYLALYGELAA
jgi:glycosyltransferase involved in cell wall biosynthesis